MKRIPSSGRRLAAALATVAAALVLADRAGAQVQVAATAAPTVAPSPRPTPAPKDIPVIVELKYDANGKPVGIEIPNPDPVELRKVRGDKAHWYLFCEEKASLKIQMKSNSPFASPPSNAKKKKVVSGPPTNGVIGQTYAYKIIVRIDGWTYDLVLDPIIKITPEPPPENP